LDWDSRAGQPDALSTRASVQRDRDFKKNLSRTPTVRVTLAAKILVY